MSMIQDFISKKKTWQIIEKLGEKTWATALEDSQIFPISSFYELLYTALFLSILYYSLENIIISISA